MAQWHSLKQYWLTINKFFGIHLIINLPETLAIWACEIITLLTRWGRVTHICVGKLTIISSDNGLSPERRQVIIWTNAGVLLIWPLGTNFSEILIEIQTFSLKEIRLEMSSAKWRLFGVGLNKLIQPPHLPGANEMRCDVYVLQSPPRYIPGLL